MASWIKMADNYRPKVREELLATFPDYGEGIGTIYECTNIEKERFTIVQVRTITTTEVNTIPIEQGKTFVVPFDQIPITNLHRKFNMSRE